MEGEGEGCETKEPSEKVAILEKKKKKKKKKKKGRKEGIFFSP